LKITCFTEAQAGNTQKPKQTVVGSKPAVQHSSVVAPTVTVGPSPVAGPNPVPTPG
jgi:hypothetical protein